MASFNFDRFESEFETKETLRNVINVFRNIQVPGNADQNLVPAEAGTPLHALMERLRIGQEAAPEPFNFNLGEVLTIRDATRMCQEAHVPFHTMIVQALGRAQFNRNLGVDPENWVELSRPEAADPHSEIQACHFLDEGRTVIDWAMSLPELRRLAQERLYTADMMQNCLLHLVDRYAKDQKDLIRGLTANQSANYLLSLERNRDKTTYRRKELYQLTRQPGQELRSCLTIAYRLIDKIYPPDQPAMASHRSSAKRTAIASFLPDELALPLLARIRKSQESVTPLSDEIIRQMAEEAEEASRFYLTAPLKYGRQVGLMPAANHVQFNSMETGVIRPPPCNYGMPVAPIYGNPYVAYPPFLPWDERRPMEQLLPAPLPPQVRMAVPAPMPAMPAQIPPQVRPAMPAERPAMPAQRPAMPAQRPAMPVQAPAGQAERELEAIARVNLLNEQVAYAMGYAPLAAAAQEAAAADQHAGAAQQLMAQARATALAEKTVPQEDFYNPAIFETPNQQLTRLLAGTPMRLPGEMEAGTPFQTPHGGQNSGNVRRNILSASPAESDDLLEAIPAQYRQEVRDKLLGQFSNCAEDEEVRGQMTSAPKDQSAQMQTRSKTKADNVAAGIENISLNSISMHQPMDAMVMSIVASIKEAVQKELKSPSNGGQSSSESYRRGNVHEGRYSSKEREKSNGHNLDNRGRSNDRGQSQRDHSQGRYPSRDRDRSSRGQSQGRYPSQDRNRAGYSQSYSGNRQDQRPASRGQDNRSYRDQSRDRPRSENGSQSYNRTQSRSPARSSGSGSYSSWSRPSRALSTDRSSRSSSWDTRRAYPSMRKGENCREDYDPLKQKDCTKCTNTGHHEFECRKYSHYNSKKCSLCKKCYHLSDECREVDRFPPDPGQSSAQKLEKN